MLTPPNEPGFDNTSPAIFVADSDILARMVIADYLRDCGYTVVEGASAEDVLTVLNAARKIDIVLADIRLGKTDGFRLARQIRKNFLKVDVILTAGVAKAAEKAGDLCDDGPLEKPYQPQEIVRRINLLRERRRSARKS